MDYTRAESCFAGVLSTSGGLICERLGEKNEKNRSIVDVEVGKVSGMRVYDGAEDGRWEKFVKGT
ncbi:MAG: hypothetical protein ABIL62_15580, partial [Planctomycetota bacterium]